MGNSLGKLFVVTSFGESHGRCIGAVVDGCPAGLPIEAAEVQRELERRRPAAGAGGTSRVENDSVEILSGVFNGKATGAPICLLAWNHDVDSSEYERIRLTPRPGHADYTAYEKYGGFNDFRGGGRFSGRITAGFVMAGAVARKLLATMAIEVFAHTVEIAGIRARATDIHRIKKNTEDNALKCADPEAVPLMADAIDTARREGDSVGGVVECIALGVPAGVGEPVFDTLEGDLAKAFFAIPAVKGVEFGSGFSGVQNRGSENNDPFGVNDGRIVALTNNAGGVLGGISTGMPIVVRVAVKPTPSIAKEQHSVDMTTLTSTTLTVKGRHDACIVPRAVVVTESMMAITVADFALRAGMVPRMVR